MKTQLSNIALGGTCSGDVVGGLLSWTVESLQALLFGEGGIMEFISYPLEAGEKPTINHVLDEIQMVCMFQFKTAYELLSSGDFSQGLIENLLFVTLAQWEKLSKEITQCFRNSVPHEVPEIKAGKVRQSTFENERLWEYIAQIQIDRHDPADILEPWMKKHHPEYFEDETESP